MTDLADIADKAFEREEAKANEEEVVETQENEEEETTDTSDESKVENADDSEDENEEDDGYSADDIEDDEEEVVEEKKEEKKVDTNSLPPREQFIYESLPSISVKGKDGQTYNVKIAQELPDDFEFSTKKEEMLFNQSLAAQERLANDYKEQWEKEESEKQNQQFVQQERADIQSDMAKLQSNGTLPKFKLKPEDDGFVDSPEVKEIQKYLDFYEKKNAEYAQGKRAYRVTFEDAVHIYNAMNPKKEETPKLQQDTERKKVASRVGTGQGGDAGKSERRRFAPGTSTQDILNYHMSTLE